MAIQFSAHTDLLHLFLTHRETIVNRIQALLKAEQKPPQYLQDRPVLSHLLEDCFFSHSAVATSQTPLRGQLEQAYQAGGFTPRVLPGLHNDLIHPAEMMIRAFHFWQQTRWPGGSARTRYAHTLFNVYMLRSLEFLSVRLWDDDPQAAPARLAQLQSLLDELWKTSPPDQPAVVRDARWLIPLAQSLPTDELAGYLTVARLVADTLPEADALEIQKAQVRMLGGHLTSQIRHYSTKDAVPIDHSSVVLRTRVSNALDFALLIQGLVALLKAYEAALASGDERTRLDMAGAILQGISPDPELFLNRIDLLSAYSMIEHVFITVDLTPAEPRVAYTPLGKRHRSLLGEYSALIQRLAAPLRADALHFKPIAGGYSTYGVIFGTPSTLTELMALKAIERDAESRFSLEDVFQDAANDADAGTAKRAWIEGWRRLPHVPLEVQRQYDYPQQFAEEIYHRIEHELTRHNSEPPARTGRLYLASGDQPALPSRYILSSDPQLVAALKAEPRDRAQLLQGRQEAHYLVSYETPTGWTALKKELLDEVLGAGHNTSIVDLPLEAAQVLQLMCPGGTLLVTNCGDLIPARTTMASTRHRSKKA